MVFSVSGASPLGRVWCMVFSVSGAPPLAVVGILAKFSQVPSPKRPKHETLNTIH